MKKPPVNPPPETDPDDAGDAAEDLVLRVARVATLAEQCDREGNRATAIALRRLAETLWGDSFRHHPKAKSAKSTPKSARSKTKSARSKPKSDK